MSSLLHLSDFHFHSDKGRFRFEKPSQLLSIFLDSLARSQRDLQIDYLVLSGDFTWFASSYEFELAEEFISPLMKQLNVPPERTVLIPGNHDALWKAGDREPTDQERFSSYRQFYRGIKGKNAANDLSDYVASTDLTMVALNSSSLEKKDFPGYGFVGEQQWRDSWYRVQRDPNFNKAAPRVAVLHHHLLPVTWLEPQSDENQYSLTLDAEYIQNTFMASGFRVVLHGHQHQPFLRAVSNPAEMDQQGILLAGAGSLGVGEQYLGNSRRNHFQVIRLGRLGNVEIEWYELHFSDPGRFTYTRSYFFPRSPAVQRSFRFLVGISGASSEDRSEFCRKLRERLAARYGKEVPVSLTPSPGRDLVEKGLSFDANTKSEDYAAYLCRHMTNVNEAPSGIVIFERTLLDTLAFAELNQNLTGDWLELARQLAIACASRMDAYFYIPYPDQSSDPYSRRLDTSIWTVLTRLIPSFTRLDGSLEDRINRVENLITPKLVERF
jgi:predicted MPP superfamily phosphohydrolase